MDAIAVVEVVSDDTADTDKVTKHADVPSLRCYVVLEQTAVFATLHRRGPDATWITTEHASGSLHIPGLDVDLALDDIYWGLVFAA